MTQLGRFSWPFIALIAVIAVLILADVGIVAVRLATNHPAPQARHAQSSVTAAGHPCNHGAYVAAAAHAHKGGAYVSSVAKSSLGKNGNCSAPLPAPPG
jgi:hypothetical protein